MCGRMNQNMYDKIHQSAIDWVKKHSMDDCSRLSDDFDNGGERK